MPKVGIEPTTRGFSVLCSTNWAIWASMSVPGFEPGTTWLKVKCSTDWANIPYNYEVVVPKAGIEPATRGFSVLCSTNWAIWAKLRGQDLNLRPSGYEPDELPDCSTPRYLIIIHNKYRKINTYFNGRRWIRTTEASCSRFTVCPLWPLGNPPIRII